MSFCVIIPAQDHNRYHTDGDLAPFGDTTLLEWKLAQCKDFAPKDRIYISSQSAKIQDIALQEGVGFVKRDSTMSYMDNIKDLLNQLSFENIIYTHCTTPFINASIYQAMYQEFLKANHNSLISVKELREFIFYQGKKLNIENAFILRTEIEPVMSVINGCYIFKRTRAQEMQNFIFEDSAFFALENLASIEIKDIDDYAIARELIAMYFNREVQK